MTGFFDNKLDAIIPLRLTNNLGYSLEIEAVLDTGFTEYLTLPPTVVQRLGLTQVGRTRVLLSGNVPVEVLVYMVRVTWHGQERLVAVQEAEGDALAGILLLEGSRVTLDVRYGGAVEISPGA